MAIYLDNAATTYPKPECVYKAIDTYMRTNGASAGRGNYKRSMKSEEILYKTRAALSRLFDFDDPSRVIFTCNATESINLALKGILSSGDHVITSKLEHNSVWRPLKTMEKTRDITISQLESTPDGSVDISQLDGMITDKTKLVCLAHASNVLGNILPVEEITKIAHSHNVPVLVDAAQTAGVLPISLAKSGIDLFAFTGHKGLLGPMGTGGLIIRKGLELNTLKEGGTGSSSNKEYQPSALPDKYEVGTHNMIGIAGLLAAVEFIEKTGVKTIYDKEKVLLEKLIEVLDDIPEIEIYGSKSAKNCVGLLSFNVWKKTKEGVRSPDGISTKLDDRFGIMTRAGVHCSTLAHRVIGTEKHGAIRASFSYFNEIDDVLALADALEQLV